MSSWETTVNTGNAQTDQQHLDYYRQQAASGGMSLEVKPLPGGGFHVRAIPPETNAPPKGGASSDFEGREDRTMVMAEGSSYPAAPASKAAPAKNDFDNDAATMVVADSDAQAMMQEMARKAMASGGAGKG